MNLDELQSIQSRERQASQLQHLRASFYEEVGRYIGELREQRNEVAAKSDNPFDDPDVEQISDEIRTAERTVESIYERRVGKVVKLASIAAADMPHDDDGLTVEEERLFETLVDAIEGNRETVLSVLDGETAALDCTPATGEGGETTDTTGHPGSDAPAGHRDPSAGQRTPGSADPVGEAGATEASGTPGASGVADADTDAGHTAGTEVDPGTDRPAPPDRPAGERHSNAPGDVPDGAAGRGGEGSFDVADAMGGASGGSDTRNEPAAESGTGADPDPGTGVGGERPTTADRGDRDHRSSSGGPDATGDAGSDPVEAEPIDRTTVRVTVDVGDIYGVDGRSYDLSAEDVVTLPTQNAEGLVSKDAAERLD